jgi:hypothetical protein
MSLSSDFQSIFRSSNKRQSINQIISNFGDKSFGFFIVLLALPIAMPLTPPGLPIPFGLVLALIGCQLLVNRPNLWIPNFIGKREVTLGGEGKFIQYLTKTLQFFERIVKERFTWAFKGIFHYILSLNLIVMSLILAFTGVIPIPGFNSIASLICLVIGLSFLEKDGLLALLSILLTISVVVLIVLAFVALSFGLTNNGLILRFFNR